LVLIFKIRKLKIKKIQNIFTNYCNRLALIVCLPVCMIIPQLNYAQLAGKYIDASYFTKINFGSRSHWAQPWRAYQETVPAHQFLNGVGIGGPSVDIDGFFNYDLFFEHLSKCGYTNYRIEIGWGNVLYDDETKLGNKADRYAEIIRAGKKWNMRPVLLANCNSGVPCPLIFFERTVTNAASAGATKLTLNNTQDLIIRKSGLRDLTEYWASEILITAINGNEVTLSKPLPNSIAAGTGIKMSTLKYQPFSKPGTDEYRETIAGWKRYIETISAFMVNQLATSSSTDKGYDLEIYNELTFGDRFLYINNYYEPDLYDQNSFNDEDIWSNLVKVSAEVAAQKPDLFSGVQIADGFANTIPWPNAKQQPVQVSAISKHPYKGRSSYPDTNLRGNALDVFGNITIFEPAYTAVFPEYYGTAIQTETLVRDMGPISNFINGTEHGRNTRIINGQTAPVNVWITEVAYDAQEDGVTDLERVRYIRAKSVARYLAFYLNKGVTKLCLFTSYENELGLGHVKKDFIDYCANNNNTAYPDDDKPYISPAMLVTKNITNFFKKDLDSTLLATRNITVEDITDKHNNSQFKGNNTKETPDLFNREVLAILPYQSNSKKFIIPYYVITRDIKKDLPPEKYRVTLSGIDGNLAHVKVYDPLNDRDVPVIVADRKINEITLELTAVDYPYLLNIEEYESSKISQSLSIVPNPNNGSFNLTFSNLQKGNYTLEVNNILGQHVYKETLTNFSGNINKLLSLPNIEKGVYIITLTNSNNKKISKKLLVQ
jgi:Secretion system C-terminal sorting domain